jgi:hypothetical protein
VVLVAECFDLTACNLKEATECEWVSDASINLSHGVCPPTSVTPPSIDESKRAASHEPSV